jgi:hypothetical protein
MFSVQLPGQLPPAFITGFGPACGSGVEFGQELERAPPGARSARDLRGTARFRGLRALLRPYLSGPIGPVLHGGAAWGREGQSARLIGKPAGLLPSQHDSDRDC